MIGEVSGRAEAFGVKPGMRLGEALSRCPELVLIPADPERTESVWEGVLRGLEGIGAGVHSGRPGEAYFEAAGLRGLWGGDLEGVLARARRAIGETGQSARLAVAPSRFCALAAAGRARSGRPVIVRKGRERAFLAPLPVGLLSKGLEGRGYDLIEQFEQLGIRTLGALARLNADAVADRFGKPGLHARRLARGEDEMPKPRRPRRSLLVELELPDAIAGGQLERALEMLVDGLLAEPTRGNRAIRRLRLSAQLAGGGGWRREKTLRHASADPRVLRLALGDVLEELPAPAALLRLEAEELGSAAAEQLSLSDPEAERRRRLAEAVSQTRAAAGREAVLRVLDLDPDSRLPERRVALTPFV